jgi:hypothetical protein
LAPPVQSVGAMPKYLVAMLASLIATSAFAGPNNKKNKEEAAEPAPPPADDGAKKKKNKDKPAEAKPADPPPAAPPKGDLKPGQYVGKQVCLGSTTGATIDVTSSKTIGVANCQRELELVFAQKVCADKKGQKIEYSWQFADTTGKKSWSCPR